jgi:uncharacterized protein
VDPRRASSAAPIARKPARSISSIQTKRTLYVCEVRCRSRIEPGIIDEVSRKIEALRVPRGMSVRPVLVYEGDLDPSIEAEGFFDALVRFHDLPVAK